MEACWQKALGHYPSLCFVSFQCSSTAEERIALFDLECKAALMSANGATRVTDGLG